MTTSGHAGRRPAHRPPRTAPDRHAAGAGRHRTSGPGPPRADRRWDTRTIAAASRRHHGCLSTGVHARAEVDQQRVDQRRTRTGDRRRSRWPRCARRCSSSSRSPRRSARSRDRRSSIDATVSPRPGRPRRRSCSRSLPQPRGIGPESRLGHRRRDRPRDDRRRRHELEDRRRHTAGRRSSRPARTASPSRPQSRDKFSDTADGGTVTITARRPRRRRPRPPDPTPTPRPDPTAPRRPPTPAPTDAPAQRRRTGGSADPTGAPGRAAHRRDPAARDGTTEPDRDAVRHAGTVDDGGGDSGSRRPGGDRSDGPETDPAARPMPAPARPAWPALRRSGDGTDPATPADPSEHRRRARWCRGGRRRRERRPGAGVPSPARSRRSASTARRRSRPSRCSSARRPR